MYKELSVSYTFDKIACAVLKFSQAEVKKYLKKLLALRKTADGLVIEGHRELRVFYALDDAIMAGYMNTVEEFERLC